MLSVLRKFEFPDSRLKRCTRHIGFIRETLDPNATNLLSGPRRNESFISSIFAGFARRRLQNQTNVHKLRQWFTFPEKSVTD